MNAKIEFLLDVTSGLVRGPSLISCVTRLCVAIETAQPKLFWYAQTPNGNKYYASRRAAKQAGAEPICGFAVPDEPERCLVKCLQWLGWTFKATDASPQSCQLVQSFGQPVGYLWRDDKGTMNARIVPGITAEKLLFAYLARVCNI